MATATYDLNELKRRMQGATAGAQAGARRPAHRPRLGRICSNTCRPRPMAPTCRSTSSPPSACRSRG